MDYQNPADAELDALAVTPVDEEDELLLLLLLDDLLEALLLRCLDDDETPLPLPLPPPEIPAPELVFRTLLVAPDPLPLLLVILMLVAEVAEEFMVESISFSGDEQESEEVSCWMGLYGGMVLTLPPFFYKAQKI